MGCWFSKSAADAKPPPYDYYRYGPLRYLGYAGHVGSSCRMVLPQSAVFIPQMVSTAYICSDVLHRTAKSSEKGDKQHRVVINAFDALIWQVLASVIIPGVVFNGLRTATKPLFLKQAKGCSPATSFAARFLPCALALLATPFITDPIDRGVDYLMNNTYREFTAPSEDELKDPRVLAKEQRLKEEKALKAKKEAEAKAKKAEKERLEKAKKEEKERLEKAKKEEQARLEQQKKAEKEAKERERKKCEEEAKALKAKLDEEERILKEKLKREELEFKEKQSKLTKELKDKGNIAMECK